MLKVYTNYYLKLMEPLVDKTSEILDKFFFSKYPKTLNLAARFFGVTSKITYFFLFHYLGIFIYTMFFLYVFLDNGSNFVYIYYATLHQGLASFFVNCSQYLNWSFYCLIIFLSLLFEVAFLNTVFISIPKIKERVLVVYGETYLRDYGYNSRFSTIARTGERGFIFAVGVGGAFLGAAAGQTYESKTYKDAYLKYLETQAQNPGTPFKPPERSSLLKFPFFK